MAYIEKVNTVVLADTATTITASFTGVEVKEFSGSDKVAFRLTTPASCTKLTVQANGHGTKDLELTVEASKTYYFNLDIAMYRKLSDNKIYFKGNVTGCTIEVIKLH